MSPPGRRASMAGTTFSTTPRPSTARTGTAGTASTAHTHLRRTRGSRRPDARRAGEGPGGGLPGPPAPRREPVVEGEFRPPQDRHAVERQLGADRGRRRVLEEVGRPHGEHGVAVLARDRREAGPERG